MSKSEENVPALQGILARVPTQRWVALGILAVLVAVVSVGNPMFLRWDNINGIFQQVAAMGVVALGAMMVIITGGLDFSSGAGLAMVAVFAGVMYFNSGERFLVMLLAALAMGAALGGVNGFLVTKCRLKPFVATLATMALCQGMTLLISEGQLAFLNDPLTILIGGGNLFGVISVPFLIFIGMSLITSLLLNRTRAGTYVYAIGGGEESAHYVGINVTRYKWLVYVYAGVCTAVGAIIAVCRLGQISPNLEGTFLMDAIAAAVIGGTSPAGGKGSVSGTILGVLILGVVSNALTFLHITSTAQTAVKGLIILAAIVIDAIFNIRKKK